MLFFTLQTNSNFRSILAKILVKKQAKSHYFHPFTFWDLSVFKPRTCILHHFAFLDCLPTHYFLRPITHFQPLKLHILTVILPFRAMFLMILKGLIYTFAVYFYAFYLSFSSILPRIQHHFTLHLAPKHTAFSIKTHYVQQHIALRLASKRPIFCCKSPPNRYKWRSS